MKTEIQSSFGHNVVQLPQTTEQATWASDVEAHATLIETFHKIVADHKTVSTVLKNIKRERDRDFANAECLKLPTKTKARLLLKTSLNMRHSKNVSPFMMLENEIAFLKRRALKKREEIEKLETRILMVEPKSQNEVSVLLKFLSTLLREGRPVAKSYLADVIEGCTIKLPKTNGMKDASTGAAPLASLQTEFAQV